jgi:hypothetical protein
MNFKFTKAKKVLSIILGLIIGFNFGFGVICVGGPCGDLSIFGMSYDFYELGSWLFFAVVSIISFLIIYLIWSLTQKKR